MQTHGFLMVALCSLFPFSAAQSASTAASTAATTSLSSSPGAAASSGTGATATAGGGSTSTASSSSSTTNPPDVLLNIPNLSVGKIELDVDNLSAELNLQANVASLVSINAGVQVGIQKVNITISDVEAELELIIRLGNLVDIVNRTISSLNLNPTLINILNTVTNVVTEVVGEVDGLLGSIVQGSSNVNFLIDNLGNIVQEVAGDAGSTVSSIVGNYLQNMTLTGSVESLSGGLVQKTYSYDPLGRSWISFSTPWDKWFRLR
ncbi:hypothetical protein N0V93_004683 [Gnomoniopsis smithogilvyi]|uniref:Uncharacterized protein n=1 Tax=Gnomoniopsis smithogilvyi TaxID=1191159 RepID=A0A9W9CXC7_9PEZI|nr:hypothetical protein N0V93_004683 [Gnomoniopsis smithogilvyi]